MQKQFQKFGIFVSKNLNEDKPNDKYVKYLYQKESGSPDRSTKRKIKSANDADAVSKYGKKHEGKQRSRSGRKSTESVTKYNGSETEIFFISPEEIKMQRRKLRSSEKSPDESRRERSRVKSDVGRSRTQKTDDDILKLLKTKQKISEKDDYQWLTKKEIFKLIHDVKDVQKPQTQGSNFFKKFFVFDKTLHDKPEFIPIKDHSKKGHPHTDKLSNKKEKKDESVDVMYSRDLKKHRIADAHTSNIQKKHFQAEEKQMQNVDVQTSNIRKKKSKFEDEKLIFEDLDIFRTNEKVKSGKRKEDGKPRSGSKRKEDERRLSKTEELKSISQVKLKPKSTTHNKINEKILQKKEELDQRLQNISRTNPLRHRFCLVRNTFSVVEISPTVIKNEDSVEKKKKLKAFRKYYKYNTADRESDFTTSSMCHTFSDSHKMYQEMSIEDTSKRHKKSRKVSSIQESQLQLDTHVSSVIINPEVSKKRKKSKKVPTVEQSKLKLETQVSSVVINPEPAKVVNQGSQSEKNKIRSKGTQRSRIPVPNSGRLVELARDSSPASKARRRSADLFAPKAKEEEKMSKEDEKNSTPREQEEATKIDRKKEKKIESSPRSSAAEEKSNVMKPLRPQSGPPMAQKEKIKKPETTGSRRSKMSTCEKKPIRKASPSPTPTQKSFKSPSKFSDSSSVWSKTSKRTNKTSLTSKSETKLSRRKKPEKKYGSFDHCSTKTSLSNSTFGDKSVNSSKNETSFFLTKSYKDDDKLSRWQKRKQYADSVRRNAISKNQKSSVIPPQVLEVRYLTVSSHNNNRSTSTPQTNVPQILPPEPVETTKSKEFYEDDLPEPSLELIDDQRFKQLLELPNDEALNEILSENYNFLKKDFSSFSVEDFKSSDSDASIEDLLKPDFWYNFKMPEGGSLSEISCCRKLSNEENNNVSLGSQDHIVDSLSAPGSEESGYATVRQVSRSFFERSDIKALLNPPSTLDTYTFEVQFERSSSSGVQIRSIESKAMQTIVDTSQKSVQIKMSQEFTKNEISTGTEEADKEVEIKVLDLEDHPVIEISERDEIEEELELKNNSKAAMSKIFIKNVVEIPKSEEAKKNLNTEDDPEVEISKNEDESVHLKNNPQVNNESQRIETKPKSKNHPLEDTSHLQPEENGNSPTSSTNDENKKNQKKTANKLKKFKPKMSFLSRFSCFSAVE